MIENESERASVLAFPAIQEPTPSAEDAARVASIARALGRVIAAHTGLAVPISYRRQGALAAARAADAVHHLGATAVLKADYGRIVVDVHADCEWLKPEHGALATEGDLGAEYANPEFRGEDAAVQAVSWIRLHCRPQAVSRVTTDEIAVWEETQVRVHDPEHVDGTSEISLLDAAKLFRSIYRGEIAAKVLVETHGLSQMDADAIERVVRKLLPERRQP